MPPLHTDSCGVTLTGPSSPGAFEDLKKGPEPGIREFATRQLSLLQEVTADRSGLQPSSLTGQTPSAPLVATAWSAPPRPHRARWHNIFPFERKI